jgi:hypothetical protein
VRAGAIQQARPATTPLGKLPGGADAFISNAERDAVNVATDSLDTQSKDIALTKKAFDEIFCPREAEWGKFKKQTRFSRFVGGVKSLYSGSSEHEVLLQSLSTSLMNVSFLGIILMVPPLSERRDQIVVSFVSAPYGRGSAFAGRRNNREINMNDASQMMSNCCEGSLMLDFHGSKSFVALNGLGVPLGDLITTVMRPANSIVGLAFDDDGEARFIAIGEADSPVVIGPYSNDDEKEEFLNSSKVRTMLYKDLEPYRVIQMLGNGLLPIKPIGPYRPSLGSSRNDAEASQDALLFIAESQSLFSQRQNERDKEVQTRVLATGPVDVENVVSGRYRAFDLVYSEDGAVVTDSPPTYVVVPTGFTWERVIAPITVPAGAESTLRQGDHTVEVWHLGPTPASKL